MNARFNLMRKETQQISGAGLTLGDEDCAHQSFFPHVSMSSLTWSLGRYNVSLVSPCAIPSFSSSSQSSQSSSRRTLSCNCALPAFSNSAIYHNLLPPSVSTSAPEPQTEPSKSHSLLEPVHLNNEGSSTHGDCFQQRRLLQSVLSVVVAFVMTIGVQGRRRRATHLKTCHKPYPEKTRDTEFRSQTRQRPKPAPGNACLLVLEGGAGAPGEGPLNVRRPLVVFKEGFRSRNYCLVECSEICNLIGDGDDGP